MELRDLGLECDGMTAGPVRLPDVQSCQTATAVHLPASLSKLLFETQRRVQVEEVNHQAQPA